MIHTKETSEYGGSAIADSNGNTTITSSQQQWLDPSFQLNVPLVDVDKVLMLYEPLSAALDAQSERVVQVASSCSKILNTAFTPFAYWYGGSFLIERLIKTKHF
ncbi:carnosine N-methyltransferase [Trifolium repens]|nr:carnosine N-methyltransferase [Trifolium repens]